MNLSWIPESCSFSTSLRSALTNNSIKKLTSACGRRQFSLLKAYTVNALTPSLAQCSTTCLVALTPDWWPELLGMLRFCAQRPLPSMMMAMWDGIDVTGNIPALKTEFVIPPSVRLLCSLATHRLWQCARPLFSAPNPAPCAHRLQKFPFPSAALSDRCLHLAEYFV